MQHEMERANQQLGKNFYLRVSQRNDFDLKDFWRVPHNKPERNIIRNDLIKGIYYEY
jgi:hypothetical protein